MMDMLDMIRNDLKGRGFVDFEVVYISKDENGKRIGCRWNESPGGARLQLAVMVPKSLTEDEEWNKSIIADQVATMFDNAMRELKCTQTQ